MGKRRPIDRATEERADGHWLVLAYPNNPTIRFDARVLDRVLAAGSDLFLEVDGMTTALLISWGAKAARDIAEALAPYTRSAPITRLEVYQDAKRRLKVARGLRPDSGPPQLLFGGETVSASADVLSVGAFKCWISDVRLYSRVGASLPLPTGRLQAALPMLLIADMRRREDPATLARRIADYEARLASPDAARVPKPVR